MSVTAYVGLPGSGKSYTAVEHVILPALRAGRRVVTNIPMRRDLVVQDIPGAQLEDLPTEIIMAQPERIDEFCTSGSVVVWDECWQQLPAGVKDKDIPEPFRDLFAKHRHRVDALGNSMQIVLVVQDLSFVAPFARKLVAETFRTVKLTTFGLSTKYRVDVYFGMASGPNPPVKSRVRQLYGSYKKSVYRYYISHTQSQSTESGALESAVDKRGNILRSPVFVGTALLAVGGFVYGVWKTWDFFTPELPGAPVSGANPGPGSDAVRAPLVAPPAPRAATAWRITGEVRGLQGGDQVFMTDGFRLVTLRTEAYCDRDVSGFLICQWDGAEVSDQIRYVRRAPPPPAATLVSPAPADPAG